METPLKNSWVFTFLTLSAIAMGQGCGSGADSNDGQTQPNQSSQSSQKNKRDSPKESENTANSKKETSSKHPSHASTGAGKVQKYVDGIPYDVFFDRPLKIAADNTILSAGGNSPSGKAPSDTPKTTPEPMEKNETTLATSWDQVISQEMLLDEIKRIRNKLNSKLNSVGNFNRELLSIQIDAATLAAMAGIAGQHSGKFTWKDKAKYVRDFSSEIAIAAENRGRSAFEVAEKPFLNIIEILDGGSPAELPDSADKTVFSDVADRNLLMKNIKENGDWIRTTISNEAEMKSHQEVLLARATLLAAIGQVVNQEDYAFADEENYQKFCRDLINGSLIMTEGIKGEDYSIFQKGFALFNKSCNDCHPEYLNN